MARFRARTRQERRLLAESVVFLTLAKVAVFSMPFRRMVRLLDLRQPAARDTRDAEPAAFEIAWAVGAASTRLPFLCTCLIQAVAGAAMLRRRHIPASLFLGVRSGGAMSAHAWLSSGGAVLLGDHERETYTAVAGFHG